MVEEISRAPVALPTPSRMPVKIGILTIVNTSALVFTFGGLARCTALRRIRFYVFPEPIVLRQVSQNPWCL